MSIKRILQAAAIASVAALSLSSVSAHACGVVGCLLDSVAPGVGTALDRANAQAGQPFDHAAAAALDSFVPGAGRLLEGGWALQRSGMLPNIQDGSQGFQTRSVAPNVAMGNFCVTNMGVFGPGPWNPVGSFCRGGPYGAPGQVVR
jgi:hypothetical protein